MKIRNVLLVAGALAIAGAVSTSVFAGDPIADRKAAMKANGAAAKVVGDMMAEGGTYDAAKAAEAAELSRRNRQDVPGLVPGWLGNWWRDHRFAKDLG